MTNTNANIFRNRSLFNACVNLGYFEGRPWGHFMTAKECEGYMTKGWGSFAHGHSVEVSNPRYGWATITEHKWSDIGTCALGRPELDYDVKTTVTVRIDEAIVILATLKWDG